MPHQQRESDLRPPDLVALVFGEALIDLFPDRRVVAGAPLNVAVHLAASGWHVRLVSRVGDDGDGATIRKRLTGAGIDPSLVETDRALPTGRVTVSSGPAGEPGYVVHRPAAWDAIAGPAALPRHDVLYFGSLAARAQQSRAAWRRVIGGSAAEWRVFDVNLRPPDVDAEVLREGLARATLVKASAGELSDVARLLGMPPTPAALHAAFPDLRIVAVTHGASGAGLYRRDGTACWQDAPKVQASNTVGAGDAFTAGLINALVRSPHEGLALKVAVRHAARVLTEGAA